MMRILCRALELGTALLLASGCAAKTDAANSSPPQSVSGEVTPQLGASLTVGDGASLQVPADSVAETKTVKITEASFDSIAAPMPASAAQPFAFTPDGTTFDKPVTITLHAVDGADQVLRLDNEQDSTWEVVDGATFVNGVATFQTTHFCIYVTAASGHKGSGGASSVGGASSSSGGQSPGIGGASVSSGGANLGTGGALSSGGAYTATGGKTAGAGGALVSTGGAVAATGGKSTATGGTFAATGGKSTATGGTFAATGGALAATGGKSAATGGASAATGGMNTATGGAFAATGGAWVATGGMSTATGGSATGGANVATGGQLTTGGASSSTGGSSSVVATNFCTTSDAAPTACYTAGMASCSTSISACCADSGCSFALTCTLKGSAGETACVSDAGSSSRALYNTTKQCLVTSGAGCPLSVAATTH